jgi:hypothetical protein
MGRLKQLIVLGSGPIGLLCALRGRQLGMDVDIYTNGLPLPQDPPRVECVPAQVVALLIEFGVSPTRIGVDALFHERIMQWSSRAVVVTQTPDVAHVGRPALDIALLETALRTGARINALQGSLLEDFRRRRNDECLFLDASGRSAVTATQRIGPKRPLVARLFHLSTRASRYGPGLMIAAGAEGYAYRLANAATLTIGVVGRKGFVRGDSQQIVEKIAAFAPWLVRDVASSHLQSGASGAASVQWSRDDNVGGTLVGDASFARDALASQGLAIGFSNALKAITQPDHGFHKLPRADEKKTIILHCRRVVRQINSSTFRSAPPWIEYSEFLSNLASLAQRDCQKN